MNTEDAIRNRYSCRNFLPEEIDRATIIKLLELANASPSFIDHQNRHFTILTDKADREFLSKMNNQKHLAEASVVILITTKLKGYYERGVEEFLESLKDWDMTIKGKPPEELTPDENFMKEYEEMLYKFQVIDGAVAAENLLIAATDLGLASCWIGIMDIESLKKYFKIPEEEVPICLVALGFEKEPPTVRTKRKPIEELTHWGKW